MAEDFQPGPGAELKATREGMKVSPREVADALKLPTHVIEALEADDFERLPPTVFTRGYLRSYARLLELPPEPLLARYPEVTEEVDVVTGESPMAVLPGATPGQVIGIAAAVALVLILLLIWFFADGEADQAPAVDVPAARSAAGRAASGGGSESSRPAPETAPLPEASAVETSAVETSVPSEPPPRGEAAGQAPATVPPAPAKTPALLPEAVPGTTPGMTPAQPVAVPLPDAPNRRERRITEFGDDELTLVFSEDCWVEVKSAAGESLYSDLSRAGWTLVLTGQAPFRLLLGYAPGVAGTFNGEAIPLQQHSRNNVANLVLGE